MRVANLCGGNVAHFSTTRQEELIMKEPKASIWKRTIHPSTLDKVYEHCAVCWTKTEVRKETPVELRNYYVEGVGQLCPRCYRELRDY